MMYIVLICIYKKKKRKKNAFYIVTIVLLLIHSQIFNFNIKIQFCVCYILFLAFSSWCMWMCISYTRVWNSCIVMSKSQKQNYIESMAYHQKKLDLNRWVTCTQHTKQNKQRNKNFKWAIQVLAIATYTW